MNANRLQGFSAFAALALMSMGSGTARADWPQALSGLGHEQVTHIKKSENGDVFVVGQFTGSIEIGSTTLVSQGLEDIFIARLDAGGTLIWAKSAGGPSLDRVRDFTLDTANNIYCINYKSGNCVSFNKFRSTVHRTKKFGFSCNIASSCSCFNFSNYSAI